MEVWRIILCLSTLIVIGSTQELVDPGSEDQALESNDTEPIFDPDLGTGEDEADVVDPGAPEEEEVIEGEESVVDGEPPPDVEASPQDEEPNDQSPEEVPVLDPEETAYADEEEEIDPDSAKSLDEQTDQEELQQAGIEGVAEIPDEEARAEGIAPVRREDYEPFYVIQEEDDIRVKKDEGLTLDCTGNSAWQYCRWTFYEKACDRTVDSSVTTCNIDDSGRVRWQGVPSIDQTCTIAIGSPELQDSGVWTCQLIQKNNRVASKSFKVTVYSETEVVFGARPQAKMLAGQNYTVECQGLGGVPTPQLVALIGPSETVSGSDVTLDEIERANDGMRGGTVSTLFHYQPTPAQKSLFVKCLAVQTDGNFNVYDPSLVVSAFEVIYPPQQKDTPREIFYLDEGATARVTVTFEANPIPQNDEVAWHIVRQEHNQSLALRAGKVRDRYEALSVKANGTRASATLLIYQTNFEDTLHFYYLEAWNDYGRTEYNFGLARRPPATTPESEVGPKSPESGGLSVGAIVGIVVGILLFIVALVILICFLYKEKLCCFAPGSSAKISGKEREEYMSPSQRDNEMQNVQLLTGQYIATQNPEDETQLDERDFGRLELSMEQDNNRSANNNASNLRSTDSNDNDSSRSTSRRMRESYLLATNKQRDSTYPVK